MKTAAVRNLFPGGNTPQGFFSYYEYIIAADAKRIFILKGGPGTGKSTFMRKIGEAMLARGFDIEFHHCSSDNNSLDGVVIPALKVALIDGTAPHIVDPKHPGCTDEILNLGEYWQENGIAAHKTEILCCTQEISKNYQRAYRLLRAAKLLYDDTAAVYTEALDIAKANQAAQELIGKIFPCSCTAEPGKIRKLFASAITPDGPKHYLASSVWRAEKCYVIEGDPGTGKSTIVRKVIEAAVTRGLDTEVFYCPLEPEKPEHVVIPALSTAVTTSHAPHIFIADKNPPLATINTNEYLNPAIPAKYQEQIEHNRQMFEHLWTKAIKSLHQSKQLHDQLERCYIPHMNFQGIQALWERTLTRILSLC